MADVDNGDILRIAARLKVNSLYDIVNVYHVYVSSGGSKSWALVEPDIQEYVDDIYQEIDIYFHTSVESEDISLANLTQDTVAGSFAWSPTVTGNDGGEILPLGVCVFTWGRTYKPRVQMRKYWSGFTETQLTNGLWLSALTTACSAAMSQHVDGGTMTGGLQLVGVAYNRTLSTYTIGTSVAMTPIPAYQRRRKQGVGS